MLHYKNEILRKTKNIFSLFILGFFLSMAVNAQQASTPMQQKQTVKSNFEDAELEKFASAAGKVVVIQQETEKKMIQAIEEEELDLNKFNEIMTAQQNQQTENLEATPEELQKFDKAAAQLMKIQTEVQSEMVEVIQEEGLEPQQYEQILLAYQSNQEVKAKIDALINQ